MTKISAILLAAGLSGRMGADNKLLMPLGAEPMVLRAYNRLRQSNVDEVIVVTGRDHKEVSTVLTLDPTDKIVFNERFSLGMTTSIQAGFAQAQGDACTICLADMPDLTSDHYNTLVSQYRKAFEQDSKAILAPKVNTKRGNPVIFSNYHRAAVLTHLQMNGCRQIVQDNLNHLVEYITEDRAYITDIDTPEDYSLFNQ